VERNHVYVISPNMSLAIWNGVLKLPRVKKRSPHHSIDSFLESLTRGFFLHTTHEMPLGSSCRPALMIKASINDSIRLRREANIRFCGGESL
jgi:hypothetical protein